MALGASHWSKYGDACVKCGTKENLTRHHLKNSDGNRTGEIIVLCWKCHQEVEAQ